MRRSLLYMLAIVALFPGRALWAQSPDELRAVRSALIEEVTALMQARVLPVMQQWKSQFDAAIPTRDRALLEQLRERYDMVQANLNNNLSAREAALNKEEYGSVLTLRTLLEKNFQIRQRILGDAARIAERNKKPFNALSSRIDSSAEEWRAAAMRIFIDWFTRHRHVITPAMNGPLSDELAQVMLSCKNIGLDQLAERAHVAFLLWDGEDFTPEARERGVPDSPLTNCRPDRSDIMLLEPAVPNPFRDETQIRFMLPAPADVHVRVYDARGRTLKHLLRDARPAGKHIVILTSEGMEPGAYHVVLEAGERFDVISVRLLR
ncbi:MAG: hypothetical protein KFF77_00665 [Bacteroidetes bacterium]|nr:hypothetical protein [Bacteroidota bacterium]